MAGFVPPLCIGACFYHFNKKEMTSGSSVCCGYVGILYVTKWFHQDLASTCYTLSTSGSKELRGVYAVWPFLLQALPVSWRGQAHGNLMGNHYCYD